MNDNKPVSIYLVFCVCIADMNLIAKQISLRLTVRDTKQKIEKLRNTIVTFMSPSDDLP